MAKVELLIPSLYTMRLVRVECSTRRFYVLNFLKPLVCGGEQSLVGARKFQDLIALKSLRRFPLGQKKLSHGNSKMICPIM